GRIVCMTQSLRNLGGGPLHLSIVVQSHRNNFRHARFLHRDAEDGVGYLHHAFAVCNHDEMGMHAHLLQHVCESAHVRFIQCSIHFIQHAEGAWLELEDCHQQRQGCQCFFSTGKQKN